MKKNKTIKRGRKIERKRKKKKKRISAAFASLKISL
jgi:hypothetical protein